MRRVLITGGGCIERIDSVRSITNFSTGRTACEFAGTFLKAAESESEDVLIDMLMSASALQPPLSTRVSVERFTSAQSLLDLMEAKCRFFRYDMIIHAAAVSDYSVEKIIVVPKEGKDAKTEFLPAEVEKLSSSDEIYIKLKNNPKILPLVKNWTAKKSPAAVLVAFKLTSKAGITEREDAVRKIFGAENPPDFVAANDLSEITESAHHFSLWKNGRRLKEFSSTESLAAFLWKNGFASC